MGLKNQTRKTSMFIFTTTRQVQRLNPNRSVKSKSIILEQKFLFFFSVLHHVGNWIRWLISRLSVVMSPTVRLPWHFPSILSPPGGFQWSAADASHVTHQTAGVVGSFAVLHRLCSVWLAFSSLCFSCWLRFPLNDHIISPLVIAVFHWNATVAELLVNRKLCT